MNKRISETLPLDTSVSLVSFLNQINEKKEELIKQGFSLEDIKVVQVETYDSSDEDDCHDEIEHDNNIHDTDNQGEEPTGFALELQAERDETAAEKAARQAEVVAAFENKIITLPKIIQEANTHLSKLVAKRKAPLDPAKDLLKMSEIEISKQVNLVNALNEKYKKFKPLVGKIKFEDVDNLEKQFVGNYDIA